jgi:hypothetical protein
LWLFQRSWSCRQKFETRWRRSYRGKGAEVNLSLDGAELTEKMLNSDFKLTLCLDGAQVTDNSFQLFLCMWRQINIETKFSSIPVPWLYFHPPIFQFKPPKTCSRLPRVNHQFLQSNHSAQL